MGIHAASNSATCCVPNGTGGEWCLDMSTSEERVATICVAAERSWKNRIRQTTPVKSGIGVSVKAASYVDTERNGGSIV